MTDVPYDASDPKAVKAVAKDAKSKDLIALEGLRTMMGTEPGRAWLFKALMLADPFRNPFSSDPHRTSFNCGEINVTMQILAELQSASLDLYLQMLKENQ